MACSFTLVQLILFVLIYTTLDWKCLAEKEYLFKGSLWSKKEQIQSIGGTATIGWVPNIDKGAESCDYSEVQNWFYLRKMNVAANRVFVEIDYSIKQKSCNASECGLFLQTYYDKVNFSLDTVRPTFFTAKKISSSITPKTVTRTFVDIDSDANYITFAVQAKGVCTTVSNISIYYYYCPRNTSTSVILERTPAPREGAPTPVKGYCSKHSGDSRSSMIAYCDVKGNWVNFKPQSNLCQCPTGTEFNKIASQCTPCKVDYFKTSDEDGPCRPCPKNSVTKGLSGSTSCTCLEKHYRRSINDECKQIPAKPTNLNYTIISPDQIMLTWGMPNSDPGARFKVKCQQRDIHSFNLVPCQHISLRENGANVNARNLTVNSLLASEHYRFTVASLNDVSFKVDESEWNTAFIKIKLPDQPSPNPTVPPKTESPSTTVADPTGTTVPRTNTNDAGGRSMVSTIGDASKRTEDGPTSTSSLGPMIGGAIGGLLLIVVIVIFVVYRSKRTKKEKLIEDMDLSTVDRSYIDPAKYGNPEKAVRVFAKEIDRRQVKLDGVIGEGEFAKVHRGSLCRPNEPQIEVAVKVLKPGSSAKNREDFLTEAAVMGQFKNLNIVALEGVVTISHPVMIITEFMHNGALSKFLVEKRTQLTEDTLLTMARGIASGMRYLSRMRFVHRDLAARNVLVNENLVCKVADFGLTRELEESCQGEYVTQGGKIPIRWTAPEAYKHRRFTTASDVWSFGVVLWEIMSYGDRPYGNWDNYMVMDQVNANYRLTPPTNCPKIVHQLMMECWKSDRTQRPAFSDIVEMLERWIRNPYLLKDYEYVTEKTRMADRKSCIAKSIREYLQGIKMERYIDNFIDFGYTELYQIQHFKDNDLVNIGVPLVGHRNKIIKGINPRGGEREKLIPTPV